MTTKDVTDMAAAARSSPQGPPLKAVQALMEAKKPSRSPPLTTDSTNCSKPWPGYLVPMCLVGHSAFASYYLASLKDGELSAHDPGVFSERPLQQSSRSKMAAKRPSWVQRDDGRRRLLSTQAVVVARAGNGAAHHLLRGQAC